MAETTTAGGGVSTFAIITGITAVTFLGGTITFFVLWRNERKERIAYMDAHPDKPAGTTTTTPPVSGNGNPTTTPPTTPK